MATCITLVNSSEKEYLVCVNAINADLRRMSLDESMSALLTDDLTYANYLVSTFEVLWEQAIPAAQRIEELLKEGPPHV